MTTTSDTIRFDLQAAVAGRYSIERELGRGGMGIVFLARDVRLDRPVALKLLPPERAGITAIRERFLLEARMAARLSHPNIVPIHAVEEVGPFVFFAMQYVAGETLGDQLRREQRLLPWDAARVVREIAWALAYAHAQGVIHRDIKPDNILLDPAGRAMVSDFGIAQSVDAEHAPGRIQGTPEYLSPEQAGGEPCDPRTDLYALGAVAFHALVGQTPFTGTASEQIAQHLTQAPPSLVVTHPELPTRLSAAVDRALVKAPDHRWPNAEAMAEAFAAPMAMTTDLPVALRIWAERGREMKGLYVIWSLMFYGLATMMYTIAALDGWMTGSAVVVVSFFVMAMPLPWIGHALWRLVETRRVLEAGSTVADLRHATEVTRARREEELRFDSTRPIHWFPKLLRVVTYGAFAVAVGALVASSFDSRMFYNTGWGGLFALSTMAGIGGAMAGLLLPGRRVKAIDPWSRARSWFWRGPLGRLFARVAATGLPARAGHPSAWRPTEAALGSATTTLFEALPGVQRTGLDDLPAVVARLEHEATVARARLDAGEPGEWAHRLEAAVGAIETLRLGLLRLHAEQAVPGSLTLDLDAARALSERIDYVIGAAEEVDAALGRSSQRNIQADPNARPPSTSVG
ncbi:MAG TPA: serine/threonine-protein kinase [Gemmatimonadales bacterium]|nr:serine/threonine-protein kinase [Gemmatimonadales bacterium]